MVFFCRRECSCVVFFCKCLLLKNTPNYRYACVLSSMCSFAVFFCRREYWLYIDHTHFLYLNISIRICLFLHIDTHVFFIYISIRMYFVLYVFFCSLLVQEIFCRREHWSYIDTHAFVFIFRYACFIYIYFDTHFFSVPSSKQAKPNLRLPAPLQCTPTIFEQSIFSSQREKKTHIHPNETRKLSEKKTLFIHNHEA